MAIIEYDDSRDYAVGVRDSRTLRNGNGFANRWSEQVVAALRSAGILDNMVDGTTAPATDKLWLDKNTDPAILKEWDSVGASWLPVTFNRIFARAVVTPLTVTGGDANDIVVSAPSPFFSERLYSLTVADGQNEGAVTITVSGFGTFDLVYPDGADLLAAEIAGSRAAIVLFTNGRFELLSSFAATNAAQAAQALAEAARDLAQDYASDAASVSGVNIPVYASVASATGAEIPSVSKRLYTQFYAPIYADLDTLVGGAHYRRTDAEPTHNGKFRSVDRFMPDGTEDLTNGGWWVLDERRPSPLMFGAVGDGVEDDQPAITAAITYARSIAAGISTSGAKAVVDLGGKMYGLGSTLFCDNAANVTIQNGAFKAVGTWTETANIMRAVNPIGDAIINFEMHRVFLDCDHKCTGLRLRSVNRGRFSFVRVSHQKNYGIKAEVKNTDTVFDSCGVNQFDFGETGWDAIANRTADGFWIDCPDVMLSNCVANYNKRNLLGTDGTCQIINFHPYNGGTIDGTNNINIELDGARGYTILGLYNDAGIIRIRGEADNEFAHRIDGFTTKGADTNNVNAVELVATRANENAAGLYINMTSRGLSAGASLLLSTEGSGTWSDIKGSVLFRDQVGAGSCDGHFVVPDGSLQNPGLSFSENAGDGFYSPSPNRVGAVAANAAAAFFTTAGVLPGTSNNSTLGTVSEYWQALFSNRLHIRDNVSAPGAVQAGFCTLYVDAADGDLKILFSDGTTKTIMTDS